MPKSSPALYVLLWCVLFLCLNDAPSKEAAIKQYACLTGCFVGVRGLCPLKLAHHLLHCNSLWFAFTAFCLAHTVKFAAVVVLVAAGPVQSGVFQQVHRCTAEGEYPRNRLLAAGRVWGSEEPANWPDCFPVDLEPDRRARLS